jgi:hypothetical protein
MIHPGVDVGVGIVPFPSREAAGAPLDPLLPEEAALSPAVLAILRHLCVGDCHAIGAVLEWCEARGDCVQAVVCPVCDGRFVIDDDEADELRRWTDAEGRALVCGVVWD